MTNVKQGVIEDKKVDFSGNFGGTNALFLRANEDFF